MTLTQMETLVSLGQKELAARKELAATEEALAALRNWTSQYREIVRSIEYKVESVANDVALQISGLLEAAGISRADLARRIGVSRAYISQSLEGKNNMTIAEMVKLGDALGAELAIRFRAQSEPASR